MATEVFGYSDDNIAFKGDFRGEVGCYGTDEQERGVLLVMSDGTMLEAKYGKHDRAIWEVKLIRKGALFLRIDLCDDEDANPYSDVAHFADGIKWVYAATEWSPVS
jgi:hypothetical protein